MIKSTGSWSGTDVRSIVKFLRHVLNVTSFAGLEEFYCGALGMTSFGSAEAPLYGFDSNQCLLEFRDSAKSPYLPESNDFYWKIGITVPDLDAAIASLRSQGFSLADPYQFRDIGYMSKIEDPNGFVIELLQQGFEGNAKPVGTGHPIGGHGILAHITLRVSDITAAQTFCEKTLGLRLISVQPVTEYGFCLYFYCWNEEPTPDPDLVSVDNREWLWRRPYTLLELQHLEAKGSSVRKVEEFHAGFDGFAYGTEPAEPHYLNVGEMDSLY